MKKQQLIKIIFLFFFLIYFHFGSAQDTSLKVQRFLPEIVSRFPDVRDLALSPAEDEVYFTVQSYLGELSSIVCVRSKNDRWSNPQIATFSGKFQDLEPFFTADGLRLYFVSNRPLDTSATETKDYDIWYVDRKDLNSAWSEPVNVGAPVNTKDNEFYPSLSRNNNLYFTSDGTISKGKDDIFFSKYVNGKYEPPVSVGDSVNTEGLEFNAFISPDETYLLYTCYNKKDGYGSGDLCISYKKENGQWTAPQNLGNKINSERMEYCPFVSSGFLYFTSRRSLVNTKFEKRQSIDEILKEMKKYENGQSRLYRVKINKLIKKKAGK
ncbi:MAG: PD40 domain-containing protein [Bacteroidia bacterium]|nr:PD40 domain-containing protein [Bacteroidia bacterium]